MTESSSPEDNRTKRLESNSTHDLSLTPTDRTIIKRLNGSQTIDSELQSDDELSDKVKQHSYGESDHNKADDTCLPGVAMSGRAMGTGSAKYSKTGGVYTCKSCSYATDKKALLLKHVKAAHGLTLGLATGQSPLAAHHTLTTTDESDDNDLQQSAAPQDRYCTNCDIQFNSFKTYKVRPDIMSRT